MNINRNNYEEFFLMYVDGELSAEQKNAVETFVQENTDLQNELYNLQQATLTVDDMMQMDKTTLYKTENGITPTNYAEYFLLYVDNELNDTDRANVETFVLQQPTLQDEFTVLKQTQLPIYAATCPNKELLYKKEEDKKPIVWMNWGRLAVAAAFIGIAVSVWVMYPNKKIITNDGLAIQNNVDKTTNNTNTQTSTTPTADAATTAKNELVKQQTTATKKEVANNASTVNVIAPSQKIIVPAVTFKKDETFTNNSIAQANNTIDKKEQVIESTAKTLVAAVNNNNPTEDKTIKEDKETLTTATVSNVAQPITYKDLDTDVPENKTVLVGGLEIRKDKIMGLFKRASKTLKRERDGK
jgi:hypothetical protein